MSVLKVCNLNTGVAQHGRGDGDGLRHVQNLLHVQVGRHFQQVAASGCRHRSGRRGTHFEGRILTFDNLNYFD